MTTQSVVLKAAGNLALVWLVAWICGIPADMSWGQAAALAVVSAGGWAVSFTIGWGRVWGFLGDVLSNIPWWALITLPLGGE